MAIHANRFLTVGKNDSPCTGAGNPLQFPTQPRMGGRVVDRARLESVFTLIGNEGSNPSPSALFKNTESTGAMNPLDALLSGEMQRLTEANLRRDIRVIDHALGVHLTTGGGEIVNFSSNDYLGLASHPALAEAMAEGARRWGTGATASRLICGTTAEHSELEVELASAKGTEASLVFSTGVAAATGTIPALVGRGDVVILDKLAHACLIDGTHASGAKMRVFPHNDLGKLESHLCWARQTHPQGRILIITESVFSMDGDLAPLGEIVELKEQHGAWLLVDEAHAIGVRGSGIQGIAGELGLVDRIEIQMGTLGKALGVSGGYIAGSRALIDFLINRARSFIFSTAPSPAVAAACRAALKIACSGEGDRRRETLRENVILLCSLLARPRAESAIIPLILGTEERALAEAARLFEDGFFVPAIRYPTVPKKTARLRVSLSAAHSPEQIRGLAATLRTGS